MAAQISMDSALERLAGTGQQVPLRILDLVDQFKKSEAEGQVLNETTVRESYLNVVLEELGWDPRNRRGASNLDQDVTLEASLKIDGVSKAPDYACRIGVQRKFFVEAKRPSVNVETARKYAHQIRRYCWSARIPFGLLTDFQEFAIYDCRAIPETSDSAAVGRIAYFRYDELTTKWPLLSALFGKEAVARGVLDELVADSKPPRNARPIDEAFLAEIRQWRQLLAADLAIRNEALDAVELNEAVQTLIDRLIFLRVVESRGLEPSDALKSALEGGGSIYGRLSILFQRADDRYNSGLFHMADAASHLGSDLKVSDETLSTVISRLYYPEPYEFSVLPADILGRIYEQFLGEVVTLNPDRSTVVQLKPDVRKAGGVYYTPTPIVEYIVDKTIGPLVQGREPKDVAKLRIIDPACGSGSFLIAAYQYLIDWHVRYYIDKPVLAKRNLELDTDGLLRLRTPMRKAIVINNIYGVDIDPQAVEVTKLSLLLKVVEGQSQLELDLGRILPDLESNIVCGNSLISTDFQMPLNLEHQEELQFNPFDWRATWPAIMADGGFDAVIGNPPYLNIDNVWGKKDVRLAYMKAAYKAVYTDKTDLLFYFMYKAAEICKGEIGYIVSRSFLEADKAQKLRHWLASNIRVREILDFRHATVFPRVGINTAIIRMTKSTVPKSLVLRRWIEPQLPVGYGPSTIDEVERTSRVDVPMRELGRSAWNFGEAAEQDLVAKIDKVGDQVGKVLAVGQGMQTGRNSAFVVDVSDERYQQLHANGFAYVRARNSDIHKYRIDRSRVRMIYPHTVSRFTQLPPDVQSHLQEHRKELELRAAFERGNCDWWQYSWPLHKESMGRPRIFCPYRASTNRFALDSGKEFLGITDTTVLYDNNQPEDLRYILGILNSRLATFRFSFLGKLLGGGVFEYYENTVSRLRLPRIDPTDARHIRMVSLVDSRIEAEIDLRSTSIQSEKSVLEASIRALDDSIDQLTEQLFGLSESDRKILAAWGESRPGHDG